MLLFMIRLSIFKYNSLVLNVCLQYPQNKERMMQLGCNLVPVDFKENDFSHNVEVHGQSQASF